MHYEADLDKMEASWLGCHCLAIPATKTLQHNPLRRAAPRRAAAASHTQRTTTTTPDPAAAAPQSSQAASAFPAVAALLRLAAVAM
jgi:hypothetical protein